MGYTHYFHGTGETEMARGAVDIIRELLEEGWQNKVIAYEYDKRSKKPVCTEKTIRFNGRGDDGHETFVFDIADKEFNFCKTARKPYDDIVTKVLLTIKHFHPDLDLSSDGDMDGEEWEGAREWAKRTLPTLKTLPTFEEDKTVGFTFNPKSFRKLNDQSHPDTPMRGMKTSPFILIKKDGTTLYAKTETGKDELVSSFNEKEDLLLFPWVGKWSTDVFVVSQEAIDKFYS